MVVHIFNPSTWEAGAGGSLRSRTARALTEKQYKNKCSPEALSEIYDLRGKGKARGKREKISEYPVNVYLCFYEGF